MINGKEFNKLFQTGSMLSYFLITQGNRNRKYSFIHHKVNFLSFT